MDIPCFSLIRYFFQLNFYGVGFATPGGPHGCYSFLIQHSENNRYDFNFSYFLGYNFLAIRRKNLDIDYADWSNDKMLVS